MTRPKKRRGFSGAVRNFAERLAYVLGSAGYGFWKDDCYTRASTLTFYTVQAVVPLFAAILGVAMGFGLDDYLRTLIQRIFEDQKELMGYVINIADSILAHIRTGVVAGVSVVLLFWTSVNLLGYIEISLNDIWRVKTPRAFFQQFKDFLATLIICPLVLIVSSSLTVYFETQIAQFHGLPIVSTISYFLRSTIPVLLSCLLFFILYFLIPKTRMGVWPRVVAAIVAGIAFQLWQVLYFKFQARIFNYNATYGAFSIIPLFLIWLQVSWIIALFGAEIAAHLERIVYLDERRASGHTRKLNRRELGLVIVYHCLQRFYQKSTPMTDLEAAQLLKIPLGTAQDMLEVLERGQILSVVSTRTNHGYHPFSDPSSVTVQDVCDVIDRAFGVETPTEISDVSRKMQKLVDQLDSAVHSSKANVRLSELLRHTAS